MVISIVLLLVLFGLVLKFLSDVHQKNNLLPGPLQLPIIGNLHLIGSQSLHVVLEELSKIYGKIYQLKLGSWDAVILCDKALVDEAFLRKKWAFAGRPNLPTFINTRQGFTGISLCEYDQVFASNKKNAIKAIHKLLLDKSVLERRISDESRKMIYHFDQFANDGEEFYPMDEFENVIPSLFISIMYGINYKYHDPELIRVVHIYRKWFDAAEADNPADFFPFMANFPNKRLSQIQECGIEFEKFNLQALQKEMNKSKSNNNNAALPDTILKHMLADKSVVSSDEMREVAKVASDMVGGGFDTSTSVLNWALLYLLDNKHVLEKCRKELSDVTNDNVITSTMKKHCPYFAATVYEILRMSTVAPTGLVHSTTEDVSLQDYVIKKGTIVIANLHQINHSSQLWEDPYSMQPERFLNNDNTLNFASTSKLMTFSNGIRRCPADKLANSMVFCLLGTLIKRYEFELTSAPEDMQPLRGVTAKPKHHKIKLAKL